MPQKNASLRFRFKKHSCNGFYWCSWISELPVLICFCSRLTDCCRACYSGPENKFLYAKSIGIFLELWPWGCESTDLAVVVAKDPPSCGLSGGKGQRSFGLNYIKKQIKFLHLIICLVNRS